MSLPVTTNQTESHKAMNREKFALLSETLSQITQAGKAGDKSKMPAYLAVFLVLVESMQASQQTVQVSSKYLKANAEAQNEWNIADENLKFSQLPASSKKPPNTAEINRVQDENEEVQKQIDDVQNNLIELRQQAQREMTQANTYVDNVQQKSSEDTGWLRDLNTVFKVINQMTQPGIL